MLLLLFHLGENLYAIETDRIIEIVPMVMLRSIQPHHNSVVSVFNYHGSIVPAIDLSHLINGKPGQSYYRTRIIIVSHVSASEQASQPRQIGLIAERVTETLKVSIEELNTAELVNASPYLGELLLTEKGMVQLINWKFISDALAAPLTDNKDGEWCKTLSKSF